jgi:hypothetical protein
VKADGLPAPADAAILHASAAISLAADVRTSATAHLTSGRALRAMDFKARSGEARIQHRMLVRTDSEVPPKVEVTDSTMELPLAPPPSVSFSAGYLEDGSDVMWRAPSPPPSPRAAEVVDKKKVRGHSTL